MEGKEKLSEANDREYDITELGLHEEYGISSVWRYKSPQTDDVL